MAQPRGFFASHFAALKNATILRSFDSYTSAEHDATVVAWKEKVRHDLVRPTTFIQRTKESDTINTWGGPYAGTQQIRGKDFQPYKRVMPHSEYPSGSACLCEAIQEFTDAYFVRTEGTAKPQVGLAATVAAGSSNAGRHGVRPKLTRRSAHEKRAPSSTLTSTRPCSYASFLASD